MARAESPGQTEGEATFMDLNFAMLYLVTIITVMTTVDILMSPITRHLRCGRELRRWHAKSCVGSRPDETRAGHAHNTADRLVEQVQPRLEDHAQEIGTHTHAKLSDSAQKD